MTTENKIPPNWPEALVMADKIAAMVEKVFKSAYMSDLELMRILKDIGVLVGVEWMK